MKNPFEEDFADQSKPKRPVLLTVLCILTFIGAGITLLSSVVLSVISEEFIATMVEASPSLFSEESVEMMMASIVEAKRLLPYTLSFTLVNLTGAILMFMLKRIGFYLYTGVQLLNLILLVCFNGDFNISVALFTILFIILYAVNYKALK
ncbi:hypothetical protein LJB94_00040 [Odoribacter sp. OttesenSCG-928-G04]|nr:hypothetical protein [Odoribacter sp. OttesenSCG-928-G04]MDL2331183.1 hypothetical protein [Odoribacter sp. OttesenSCG-928-A06]